MVCYFWIKHSSVAQLVERSVWGGEVAGSSPVTWTTFLQTKHIQNMDATQKVKELRQQISPIICRNRALLLDYFNQANKPNSFALSYMQEADTQLCLAFSWLGEALGKLNFNNSPYIKGNDVTTNKVEPTNDWKEWEQESFIREENLTIEIKEIRQMIKDVCYNLFVFKQPTEAELPNPFTYPQEAMPDLKKCENFLIQAKNILGFTFPFIGEVVK